MRLLLTGVMAGAMALTAAQARAQTSTVPAAGGDIIVTPIAHASLQIEHAGKVIHVDPFAGMGGDYTKTKQADLVLITDIHGDHLDPGTIGKVRKAGVPVVIPAAAKDKVPDGTVIANAETKTVAGVPIEAIPAYNLQRGPKPGEFFHTKGRANGYVLTLGGKRVFIAGDTECVPEIKALKNIDVAFLPMNLPYTMPVSEAVECVKAFKPKIVFPYHHRGQKPEEFQTGLKDAGIEVRVLNWYPAPPSQ